MTATDLVFAAIDSVNQQVEDGGGGMQPVPKSRDVVLMGDGSALDSLTLVNLIVAVEDQIAEKTGKMVTLVDEDIFSAENYPLNTVGSLIELVNSKLSDV